MEQLSTPSSSSLEAPPPKLSICISTLNRAKFLHETLNTIVPQLTDQCELLVVDNASDDNTTQVVSAHVRRCDRVRYMRMDTNNGMDRNFDRAVDLARGDYCWLASDDDFFKPGAVAAVLQVLDQEPSAVFVNYEFKDFSMSKILQTRVLDLESDRVFGPWEADGMFVEFGDFIRFIGAVVIRRSVWLSRQRYVYVGSAYHFVGMIYQERFPRHVHVIAEPYVSYRYGNVGTYSGNTMEIVLSKWPSVVASLPLSRSAKRKLHSAEPWKHPFELLVWRGIGFYTYDEYRRWLRPQLRLAREKLIPLLCAALPCSLANLAISLYLSSHRNRLRQMRGLYLTILEESRFHYRNWKPGSRKHPPADVRPKPAALNTHAAGADAKSASEL